MRRWLSTHLSTRKHACNPHLPLHRLCLADISPSAVTYTNQARTLAARHTLQLLPDEAVRQVAWQRLTPSDGTFHTASPGAASAVAAAAAVLTTRRVLLLSERLTPLAVAAVPGDLGVPLCCLWVGPAVLVSTSSSQVLSVGWDGRVTHLCSLLSAAAPQALVGALADRLLLASKVRGPLAAGGRTEVCGRGFSVLEPMLQGWASLATHNVLPGAGHS
jgi:hypothetical protein